MLGRAGGQQATVRGDDVRGHEVVAGHPGRPPHPAQPAAEGEAADAGLRVQPEWREQPEGRALPVDVGDQGTSLRPDGPGGRVDPDGAHRRQVDDEPTVEDRTPGHVMASSADGDAESLPLGEAHGVDHVGDALAGDDRGRHPIHGAVPDAARRVEVRLPGQEQPPSQGSRQLIASLVIHVAHPPGSRIAAAVTVTLDPGAAPRSRACGARAGGAGRGLDIGAGPRCSVGAWPPHQRPGSSSSPT